MTPGLIPTGPLKGDEGPRVRRSPPEPLMFISTRLFGGRYVPPPPYGSQPGLETQHPALGPKPIDLCNYSGFTCCLNFPGAAKLDLRKLAVNLISLSPAYFSWGFAPLTSRGSHNTFFTVPNLLNKYGMQKNMIVSPIPAMGPTDSLRHVRGKMSKRRGMNDKRPEQELSYCGVDPQKREVKRVGKGWADGVYRGESNMNLVAEYQQYQDATNDEEKYNEGDEEQ
nr:tubulin beta chain-like [Ipomoea batatas]